MKKNSSIIIYTKKNDKCRNIKYMYENIVLYFCDLFNQEVEEFSFFSNCTEKKYNIKRSLEKIYDLNILDDDNIYTSYVFSSKTLNNNEFPLFYLDFNYYNNYFQISIALNNKILDLNVYKDKIIDYLIKHKFIIYTSFIHRYKDRERAIVELGGDELSYIPISIRSYSQYRLQKLMCKYKQQNKIESISDIFYINCINKNLLTNKQIEEIKEIIEKKDYIVTDTYFLFKCDKVSTRNKIRKLLGIKLFVIEYNPYYLTIILPVAIYCIIYQFISDKYKNQFLIATMIIFLLVIIGILIYLKIKNKK